MHSDNVLYMPALRSTAAALPQMSSVVADDLILDLTVEKMPEH